VPFPSDLKVKGWSFPRTRTRLGPLAAFVPLLIRSQDRQRLRLPFDASPILSLYLPCVLYSPPPYCTSHPPPGPCPLMPFSSRRRTKPNLILQEEGNITTLHLAQFATLETPASTIARVWPHQFSQHVAIPWCVPARHTTVVRVGQLLQSGTYFELTRT
jgi:hypothetical protein